MRPLVTARAQEDNALAASVSGSDPELPLRSPPPSAQPESAPPQPPNTDPSRPSRWAVLLARIYEAFPLVCPTCQSPLTFIAFLTDPEPITQILAPTDPSGLRTTSDRAPHGAQPWEKRRGRPTILPR